MDRRTAAQPGIKRSDSKESIVSRASMKSTSTVKSERVRITIISMSLIEKQFADKASGNLYDIYKKFDAGKINADTFIKKVESVSSYSSYFLGGGYPSYPRVRELYQN